MDTKTEQNGVESTLMETMPYILELLSSYKIQFQNKRKFESRRGIDLD